jgi:hypothetical protein
LTSFSNLVALAVACLIVIPTRFILFFVIVFVYFGHVIVEEDAKADIFPFAVWPMVVGPRLNVDFIGMLNIYRN